MDPDTRFLERKGKRNNINIDGVQHEVQPKGELDPQLDLTYNIKYSRIYYTNPKTHKREFIGLKQYLILLAIYNYYKKHKVPILRGYLSNLLVKKKEIMNKQALPEALKRLIERKFITVEGDLNDP